MFNTLFFAPVEHITITHTEEIVSFQDDPDNSLLELILEDYLDSPETSATPEDDTDHGFKKLDFMAPQQVCLFTIRVQKFFSVNFYPYWFIKNPYLETLTPPPK